ncbi:MAG: FkbM family methyltransferase [Nitrososphaerota archaeon]
MFDVVRVVNRVLRVKGNLVKINFIVDGRMFEAFVPDDQYFIAIKDILLNREYEYIPEFELLNFKGKRVVDAGAHVGLYSLVASVFAKEVISIEPHPLNFRILELNKIINLANNIIPLNKALWSERATLELHEGTHTGGHSVLQNSFGKGYIVQSITLGEIIDEFGKIDLLKMDVEGSEFEIFKRLDANIMKKISHLCMEVHLQKGEARQIEEFLSSNGFSVMSFHPPIIKKHALYRIELKNFVALKAIRKLIYGLSNLMNKKDDTLVILFGKRSS